MINSNIKIDLNNWQQFVVSPEAVIEKLTPGMNIFLSTGVSEPRTLVKYLTVSPKNNLEDIELIQLASVGDRLLFQDPQKDGFRLKTFSSGWLAADAISEGRIDFIPARTDDISRLIQSGQVPIDVAFIQISPPNESGFCSLGMSVDVAREAMDRAELAVGEINCRLPRTYGNTFVSASEFDLLVEATEPPFSYRRFKTTDITDQLAKNIASVIPDGSCLSFSLGPMFESLGKALIHKHNLSLHTHFFSDVTMELVEKGVVTNRFKKSYPGKSLTSYAVGTPRLLRWLDRNPLVEFQGIDITYDSLEIGRNPHFVAVFPVRKADLTGCFALPRGKTNLSGDPRHIMHFINGAEISKGGKTVFALPSRNDQIESNIKLSLDLYQNQFTMRESIDMLITEWGVAYLKGRTIRERAQAIIDVAHPDDRPHLMEQAKAAKLLYADQVFINNSAHLYPINLETRHQFEELPEVLFRAIKPSDEEEMRKLFYRFSDEAVYNRYFNPTKSMPHAKIQHYVNIDYQAIVSVVGTIEVNGKETIIAEGRFSKGVHIDYPDIAFVVDEVYQSRGIASYLLSILIRQARERGFKGFTGSVLATNKGMIKVFEKSGYHINAELDYGTYEITLLFDKKD